MTVRATNIVHGNTSCSWETPTEFIYAYRALIPANNAISQRYTSVGKILNIDFALQDSNTGCITLYFDSMTSYNEYKGDSNNSFITILTDAGWSREETVEEL